MEQGHAIDIRNRAYFRHLYDPDQAEMRRLYEQAKRDHRRHRFDRNAESAGDSR
jgi:hypothetical protein